MLAPTNRRRTGFGRSRATSTGAIDIGRLVLGFGLGVALAYGWQRFFGVEEAEPQPSWQGTDNDPEDKARLDDELLDRTRDSAPFDYEREPQQPQR
jgi:hypothetical protein